MVGDSAAACLSLSGDNDQTTVAVKFQADGLVDILEPEDVAGLVADSHEFSIRKHDTSCGVCEVDESCSLAGLLGHDLCVGALRFAVVYDRHVLFLQYLLYFLPMTTPLVLPSFS